MEKRLDRADQGRTPVVLPWWATTAGLLLLLLSGVGNAALSLQVHRLGDQVRRLESGRSLPAAIRDTIYLEKVLVRVDTVYRGGKAQFVSVPVPGYIPLKRPFGEGLIKQDPLAMFLDLKRLPARNRGEHPPEIPD